jgi:rhodanese-related sulfurtransferase
MLANAYGYEVYNLDGGYGQWLAAGQKITGNNVNPTTDEQILKKGFKGVPAPYAKEVTDFHSLFSKLNRVADELNLSRDIEYKEFNNFLESIGVNARLDGKTFKEITQSQNVANNALVASLARFVINGAVNNLLLRDIPKSAFDDQAKQKLNDAINNLSNGMGFLVGHILAGKMPVGTSPFGLSRIIEENNGVVQLIDVRTAGEYNGYHVPGAINVNSRTPAFIQLLTSNRLDKNITTVFLCNSGAQASEAAFTAKDYGFKNVYDLAGGTVNWVGAGLPTVLQSSALSSKGNTPTASQPQQPVQVQPGALVPPGAPSYTQPNKPSQPTQPEELEPLIPEEGFGGGC